MVYKASAIGKESKDAERVHLVKFIRNALSVVMIHRLLRLVMIIYAVLVECLMKIGDDINGCVINMPGMEDKLDLAIWDMRKHESPYADHPASYTADIPEKLIKKHTKEGDVVFDPFNGSGTTAIKACFLDRQGIGTDVNPRFLKMSQDRWDDLTKRQSVLIMPDHAPKFILDDARELSSIEDNSVDLIVTSPPYQDLIDYSKSTDRIGRDLGNLTRERYLTGMEDVIKQCGRVLKKGKFCYFIMYDITKKGVFYPSGPDVALMCFEEGSMKLKKVHIILLLALSYFSYAIKCQKR